MANAGSAKKASRDTGLKVTLAAGTILLLALIWAAVQDERNNAQTTSIVSTTTKASAAPTATPSTDPAEMKVHESTIAGSWYPDDAKELSKMIEGFLSGVGDSRAGNVRALIVPHAGYIYSGPVAGYAYAQVAGRKYDTVIILAPSHHAAFSGASIGNYTHYRTPLGLVPVSPLAGEMLKEGIVSNVPEAHNREHSDEIELPFLQKTVGDFNVVPIVIGALDVEGIEKLAVYIAGRMNDKTLLVASTDLSHYHPYEKAVALDKSCLAAVEAADYSTVASSCEMCGLFPVLVAMKVAQKSGWKATLLKYANSGDTAGDKTSVVGYGAIAYYSGEEKAEPDRKEELTAEQKKYLLGLARTTIEKYLTEKRIPQVEVADPKLREKKGVFVTLTKNGDLRGCIGSLVAQRPLYEDVMQNAVNAAVNDPRFKPVEPAELGEIEIEISVLSSPVEIPQMTPEQYLNVLKPGVDGIILQQGGRSATYLPQVWEQIPDKALFLASLCNKAGLSSNCWKEKDARLYRYGVYAFKEGE